MGDDEDSTVFKTLTQSPLYKVISLKVYVCSGFIKYKQLGFSNDCTSKTDQLLLADRKQVVTFSHVRV